MELYKYHPWRPFNNKNELIQDYHVKSNLVNHQIYLNTATKFNDPFDLYPDLKFIASDEKLLLKVMSANHLDENEAIQLIRNLELNTEHGKNQAIHRMRTALKQIGICCFTANSPETVLMWAHYGDYHKGICLVFESTELKIVYGRIKKITTVPFKVKYSTKYPSINIFDTEQVNFIKCALTKSIEWRKENEYRATSFYHIGLADYNPHQLKAVISGCKMGDRELLELQKTIKRMNPSPKLQRAVMRKNTYGLDIETL